MSSETTVPVGIYWRPAVWDLARSAYVADLDLDPDSPGAFLGWLARALEQHADRTPAARAAAAGAAAETLGPTVGRRSFNKAHPLPADTIERVEQAIVDDRRELGRVVSRSAFANEAVVVAAQDTRQRFGRDLPPPPAKLSNRPPRR